MYHLKWKMEDFPQGIARHEVKDDEGACDALVGISVLYKPDGTSYCVFSHDGRTAEELSDNELFKAWLMMTEHIADNCFERDSQARKLAQSVFDTVCELLNGAH